MSNRYELINFLNSHDKFRDTENNKDLDCFDIEEILNHYEEVLKDLDDLLCKYQVEDLEDLENRLKNATDLEAKLADMTKKYNTCQEARKFVIKDKEEAIKERTDIIVSLEKQLAEKEKEIKFLENCNESIDKKFNHLALDHSKLLAKQIHIEQDKTSFAVEQLEQLRIRIKARQEDWNTGVDYNLIDLLPDYDIYEEIDNQIKQLKVSNSIPLEDKGE